ncbi:MAG: Ni/Fe hydrogenase subunit alpha [Candidatus ainarchaeum sp.]|nr:Ni/Fe hydrogenase subunit alpha [Candidatus ainarchaeum sp.]
MHGNEHFSLHDITKIEGHASLEVQLKDGFVEKCEFRISENHRFFEDMAIGRSFEEIPLIMSRICGFCCSSHLNTAVKACEKALGVEPSEQVFLLRELSSNMEFLKSHALHLYLLVLPDYLGRESALHFSGKEHQYIHDCLDFKKTATDTLNVLGARAYHTVNVRVGGFSKFPNAEELGHCMHDLEHLRKKAIETIELFAGFLPEKGFDRNANYAALSGKNYSLLEGKILFGSGTVIPEEKFLEHVEESVIPYATATQARFAQKEYFVGALARINLNQAELYHEPKKIIRDLKLKFPNTSPFYINAAQAVEMLQAIDSSIEILQILDRIKIRQEPLKKTIPKESTGTGVTEAPRGLLFHSYSIGSDGLIKKGHIVVPTQQNSKNIEADLKGFIPGLLSMQKEKAELEIEKLIRAYDPCISCSTHFLKVDWKRL